MPAFTLADLPDLHGRVALVTGSNTGIGWETVSQLAVRGAKVYLCSRNAQRGAAALDKLKQDFGAEAAARVSVLQLDLADLDSIKQASTQVLEEQQSESGRLDILVANAGIMAVPYGLTKQGIELQFGTNVVGHAYLQALLLPLIVRTARRPEYAQSKPELGQLSSVRIVQVSSMGHNLAPWGLNLSKPPTTESTINKWSGRLPEFLAVWARYGLSKTGNIWMSDIWTNKLGNVPHISNVSLHPGVIATQLYRPFFRFLPSSVLNGFMNLTFTPADKGAFTSLYAAASPEVDLKHLNGAYLVPVAKVGSKSSLAADKKDAQKTHLWNYLSSVLKQKQGVSLDDLVDNALKQ